MFSLGVPEVLVLLIMAAGVLVPLAAGLTNRLRTRDALIAIAAAVVLPVVGSIAAILITVSRLRRRQTL